GHFLRQEGGHVPAIRVALGGQACPLVCRLGCLGAEAVCFLLEFGHLPTQPIAFCDQVFDRLQGVDISRSGHASVLRLGLPPSVPCRCPRPQGSASQSRRVPRVVLNPCVHPCEASATRGSPAEALREAAQISQASCSSRSSCDSLCM